MLSITQHRLSGWKKCCSLHGKGHGLVTPEAQTRESVPAGVLGQGRDQVLVAPNFYYAGLRRGELPHETLPAPIDGRQKPSLTARGRAGIINLAEHGDPPPLAAGG